MTDPDRAVPAHADVRVGVAMPAAGSGQRMGGVSKAFLELGGEPLLAWAIRPFLADERVVCVAVALPAEAADAPPGWLTGLDDRVVIVRGGETRGASVAAALAALPDEVEVVAVHDAARPLVTEGVVRACIELAASGVGAVAGSPAVDTMKSVDGECFVTGTPERATLWHAHTPQVFPAEVLREAYGRGDLGATDDAGLVEAAGHRVRMVDDGGTNLKVTRVEDVDLAESLLAARGGS